MFEKFLIGRPSVVEDIIGWLILLTIRYSLRTFTMNNFLLLIGKLFLHGYFPYMFIVNVARDFINARLVHTYFSQYE